MKTKLNKEKQLLQELLMVIQLRDYYVERLNNLGFDNDYVEVIKNLYDETINKIEVEYDNTMKMGEAHFHSI